MNESNREDLFVDWKYANEQRLEVEWFKKNQDGFYDFCRDKFNEEHPEDASYDELVSIVEDNIGDDEE